MSFICSGSGDKAVVLVVEVVVVAVVVAVAVFVAVVLVVIVVAVKLGQAIVKVATAAVEVEAAAAAVVAAAGAAVVCGGCRGGCGARGVGGGRGGRGGRGMPWWRLRCQVQSQRWGKGCHRMYLRQGLKKAGLDSEHRTLSENTVLGLRSRAQNFGFNTWVFAAERTVELHQLLRPALSSLTLTDALKGLKAACNKHQSAQHLEHPPP